ncbi:MAG TPA: YeeE/YedE family protein [Geobacteraceae bacterium]
MTAYLSVIAVSLPLGICAGILMHRADFCLVCTVRNFVMFRDAFMLRVTALLVIVSMGLFEGSRLLGLVRTYPFPSLGAPALTNLLGGMLFGFGMVLAGGCVVGTLYRLGAGNLLSLLAFVGLLIGSVIYAEFHPWWKRLVQATTLTPGRMTLPQLLGVPPGVLVWPAIVAVAWPLAASARKGGLVRRSHANGYLQPWKAALALAVVSWVSLLLVGMPMGITTAYAKVGGYLEGLAFPGHMAGLVYFREQPLNYLHPLTGTRLTGGPGPTFDAVAAIQFSLVGGIIAGGALSAWQLREFHRFRRAPVRQGLAAIIGGILMGLASRMGAGCNVWHILGGLPLFGLQSFLFVLGLLPGAWVGSRFLVRGVIRP